MVTFRLNSVHSGKGVLESENHLQNYVNMRRYCSVV